jgi:pSer/pThr/pTyr-binding forkhead associated (FHA) protein
MSDKQSEESSSAPAEQGPNETMMLSSDELASQVASAASGTKTVVRGTPRLVGRSDVVAGRVIDLTKAKTTVGRAQASDVPIEDGTVSARHAQIVSEDGVWRVVNLISTNGTSVNGTTSIVSYLAPGDVISFGRVEFTFEAEGGGAEKAKVQQTKTSGGTSTALWVGIGAGVLVIAGALAFLFLR